MLWIALAILTGGAMLAVLWPLSRREAGARPHGSELEVHKARLRELDEERARGRLSEDMYREARAEIARNLIASSGPQGAGAPAVSGGRHVAAVSLAALIGVPLLAFGFYALNGSPQLGDQPAAARLAPGRTPSSIEAMVAQVERRLAENPEDGRGWSVLAPVYLRLGRAVDASDAYRKAIALQGSDPGLQAGLGEALVAVNGGIVTADAEQAFRTALSADPDSPKARFFLAVAKEQSGRTEAAIADLRAMLADAPPDAPWRATVISALARFEEPQPGPDRDDIEAASRMSEEDRGAMILSMVEGLRERLEQTPQDPAGWDRLIRSYTVLERPDEAGAAVQRALAVLEDDAARARILQLARTLGLDASVDEAAP